MQAVVILSWRTGDSKRQFFFFFLSLFLYTFSFFSCFMVLFLSACYLFWLWFFRLFFFTLSLFFSIFQMAVLKNDVLFIPPRYNLPLQFRFDSLSLYFVFHSKNLSKSPFFFSFLCFLFFPSPPLISHVFLLLCILVFPSLKTPKIISSLPPKSPLVLQFSPCICRRQGERATLPCWPGHGLPSFFII